MGEATCPGCNETLVFRSGEKITKHFSHRSDSHCSQDAINRGIESIQHRSEKARLISSKPDFRVNCRGCDIPLLIITKKDTEWREEVTWKWNGTNYRIDVVGYTSNGEILLLEVVQTHRCSEEKLKAFSDSRVKWLEIKADGSGSIVASSDFRCSRCAVNDLVRLEREERRAIMNAHYEDMPINAKIRLASDKLIKDAQNDITEMLNNYYQSLLKFKRMMSTLPLFDTVFNTWKGDLNVSVMNAYDNDAKGCNWLLEKGNLRKEQKELISYLNEEDDSVSMMRRKYWPPTKITTKATAEIGGRNSRNKSRYTHNPYTKYKKGK